MPFHSVQGISIRTTFGLAANMRRCSRERRLDAGLEVLMMQDVDDQSLPIWPTTLHLLTQRTDPTNHHPSSMLGVAGEGIR